ncbi:hypothetical protein C8F01DRAFT_292329 [Mycena amicta]|nr:hypothetical protein C8F01DRAFT_292329 [Mycena amicta]
MAVSPAHAHALAVPTELLCIIFDLLEPLAFARATLVCRRWRSVAIGDARLWTNVTILAADVFRADVVGDVLARSKDRSITLDILLDHDVDWVTLHHLLQNVIKSHLIRCHNLLIDAYRCTWPTIIHALREANLLYLKSLSLQVTDTPAWQTDDEENGLAPLVFPLPKYSSRMLSTVQLKGVSLSDNFYDIVDRLELVHRIAPTSLIGDDGRLSSSIFRYPRSLKLNRMRLPSMSEPLNTDKGPVTRLQSLELCELAASPIPEHLQQSPEDIDREYDCLPFFAALDTSCLRVLVIDCLDPAGRIWDDLIDLLDNVNEPRNTPPPAKFPLVYSLTLSRMDIGPEERLIPLFNAFPALICLQLNQCYSDTCEIIVRCLQLKPELCPLVSQIVFDGQLVIQRADGMCQWLDEEELDGEAVCQHQENEEEYGWLNTT